MKNKKFGVCFVFMLLFFSTVMSAIDSFAFAAEKTGNATVKKSVLTYVSSALPCELEGMQEPMEYIFLALRDESDQQKLQQLETTEKYREWKDGFCFPITISGYDGDVFLLGDTEIPAAADLSDYADEFLRYLGLSEAYYRIDEIVWSGDSYMEGDVLCRNAIAHGEKLMRYVDVKYGGEVQITVKRDRNDEVPQVEIVEESETQKFVEKQMQEELPEGAFQLPEEQKLSLFEQLIHWIREHLTVVSLSILFLLGNIFSIVVLLRTKKEKSRGD